MPRCHKTMKEFEKKNCRYSRINIHKICKNILILHIIEILHNELRTTPSSRIHIGHESYYEKVEYVFNLKSYCSIPMKNFFDSRKMTIHYM